MFLFTNVINIKVVIIIIDIVMLLTLLMTIQDKKKVFTNIKGKDKQ